MLSFDTDLSNALKNSNTTAFWVLKLYYNDESAFIGVSDRHRQDGTDIIQKIQLRVEDLPIYLQLIILKIANGNCF